jgi:hypothetical protein
MPRVRGVIVLVAVALLYSVAAGACSSNGDSQSKACAAAVDALSANLETATRTSQISPSVATNVATTCPSRSIFRIYAKVDDIATKLGAVKGVNDPEMSGTGDTALNSALGYLCLNYGTATAACTDTG